MRQLIRSSGGARDLRVDFFRGLALWFIFIDHVPGNRAGDFTLRNIALCDATEAFVLLAGYAAGLAYGASLDRRGWAFTAAALMRRIGTLYVAHIFLFVLFTAQVGLSAAAFENSVYIDEMQLDAFGEQPYLALLQALLLRFQPAFLNILPLYIVLLLMFVPGLALLRRWQWLLGASGALYVASRLLDLNLPSWQGGGWFFNPLAWQALFCVGCALGYRPRPAPGQAAAPAPSVPWHPLLAAGCVAVLLFGALAIILVWHRPDWLERLPLPVAALLVEVDKTSLHPFRLLSMLALAYLVGHAVKPDANWVRSAPAVPFVLMGQQGLPVFCAGILFAFLGRLGLEQSDALPMQLLVNALGLAALVAVGAVAAWYRHQAAGPQAGGARAGGTRTSGPQASAAQSGATQTGGAKLGEAMTRGEVPSGVAAGAAPTPDPAMEAGQPRVVVSDAAQGTVARIGVSQVGVGQGGVGEAQVGAARPNRVTGRAEAAPAAPSAAVPIRGAAPAPLPPAEGSAAAGPAPSPNAVPEQDAAAGRSGLPRRSGSA